MTLNVDSLLLWAERLLALLAGALLAWLLFA